MNDLEQLGQLWSDFLHAQKQALKAVNDFCGREAIDDYPEDRVKYSKPEIQQERDIKKELMQSMWDKQKISNELYKKLIDTTEQYWIKEAT